MRFSMNKTSLNCLEEYVMALYIYAWDSPLFLLSRMFIWVNTKQKIFNSNSWCCSINKQITTQCKRHISSHLRLVSLSMERLFSKHQRQPDAMWCDMMTVSCTPCKYIEILVLSHFMIEQYSLGFGLVK